MMKRLLGSTISRKNSMALTGLFLCIFLVIHLLGNLTLFLPATEAQEAFNWYAATLSGNIVIKLSAYLLYAILLFHAVQAIYITIENKKANDTVKYAYDQRGKSSKWYSRSMGLLGTVILIFLIVHMLDFWYKFKFGTPALDPWGRKDLYTMVVTAFSNVWLVAFYVISMIALGYHLLHGFFSACKTLGLYSRKYSVLVKWFGIVYSIIITAGFIIIPIFIYLKRSI